MRYRTTLTQAIQSMSPPTNRYARGVSEPTAKATLTHVTHVGITDCGTRRRHRRRSSPPTPLQPRFRQETYTGRIGPPQQSDVALPRTRKREMLFLDEHQIERLADAVDSRYRALVYLLAYAGLRWGEAAALRRSAVDVPEVGSTSRSPLRRLVATSTSDRPRTTGTARSPCPDSSVKYLTTTSRPTPSLGQTRWCLRLLAAPTAAAA